MVSTKK